MRLCVTPITDGRLRRFPAPAALLLAATAAASGAAAQGQTGSAESVEARLAALEARVAVLEGRGAAGAADPAAIGAASDAVQCRRLSINGSAIAAGTALTVSVNGKEVGIFNVAASGSLEQHMQAGLNVVRLSFSAPGTMGPFGTQAELRCLAPGSSSSRDEILKLQPRPGRLSAEIRVELVRP